MGSAILWEGVIPIFGTWIFLGLFWEFYSGNDLLDRYSYSAYLWQKGREQLGSSRVVFHIIKIKAHSSCEIEYFVETHLCKLCVLLQVYQYVVLRIIPGVQHQYYKGKNTYDIHSSCDKKKSRFCRNSSLQAVVGDTACDRAYILLGVWI